MRKRSITLTVLIVIALTTPTAHPDPEGAAHPGKIELLPEQLDTVKAGDLYIVCPGGTTPCPSANVTGCPMGAPMDTPTGASLPGVGMIHICS
jgi:hypothetical protein